MAKSFSKMRESGQKTTVQVVETCRTLIDAEAAACLPSQSGKEGT
jgi:hypothetical protein